MSHIRADMQQLNTHRQKRIAHTLQEHEQHARNKLPYKAIRDFDNAMTDTGHHTITTRTSSGGRPPYHQRGPTLSAPSTKKGDWANPDSWRPILCAVTEVRIVWTILLRRIRPNLDPHIPSSLLGAIQGRSPHQAPLLQDAVDDMDPMAVVIASLSVKWAFSNTPWLFPEAVWKHLGFPSYDLASKYIHTRRYAVRTGAGLTLFLEPGSGYSQGGADAFTSS